MSAIRILEQLSYRAYYLILALAIAGAIAVAPDPVNEAGSYRRNESLNTDVHLVAVTFITCTPIGVATYKDRVHVRCAAAVGGIRFFAVSTSDAAHAARILSVISTAQAAGRTLGIDYDPADTRGTSFGCQSHDCRTIISVGFGQ
ncbi:hypothetical protein ACFQZZ_16480 [Nocardia sp. GCM10030253]|uniref:hypothetical protein n=1 Tax=Nocardia sp. GCM10030253 TaxID=3273404 RepID=UPI0036408976